MATCPRCHGYLDEGHVCRGRVRRRLGRAIKAALIGVVAAAIGAVTFRIIGSAFGFTQLTGLGAAAGVMTAWVVIYSLRFDRY